MKQINSKSGFFTRKVNMVSVARYKYNTHFFITNYCGNIAGSCIKIFVGFIK